MVDSVPSPLYNSITPQEQIYNLKIYPNPANEKLFVQSANLKSIYIYNLLGEKIISEKYYSSQPVDISLLPKGLYILTAEKNSGEKCIMKFVKE